MSTRIKISLVVIFFFNFLQAAPVDGEKIFKQYCWGCHHQTSVAFGPSFEEIANKRSVGEIQGYIVSPKSLYEQLGHKRSVMPSFEEYLSQDEINAITNFIISFKSKKD
ncbi:MAG: cytochrome c [Aliarcobacter sp.]|nr:cytochrome c [Aliarcobacter sp.]